MHVPFLHLMVNSITTEETLGIFKKICISRTCFQSNTSCNHLLFQEFHGRCCATCVPQAHVFLKLESRRIMRIFVRPRHYFSLHYYKYCHTRINILYNENKPNKFRCNFTCFLEAYLIREMRFKNYLALVRVHVTFKMRSQENIVSSTLGDHPFLTMAPLIPKSLKL